MRIKHRGMKKKTLGIIVISLILIVSFSSCNKEDFTEFNYENYRLVKIMAYTSSTAPEPWRWIEYTYDKAGNMVKESNYQIAYMPEPTLSSYTEYEYSGNKKVKENVYDGQVGNLKFSAYTNYYYVGDNLIREEYYWVGSSPLRSSKHYEYDERGNLVRRYSYEPDRGIFHDYYYSYDDQNRLILDSDYRYTYDDRGRLIKREFLTDNGLYDYIEEIYNGTSKSPEKTVYYDRDGNIALEYQHFYDEWGNLVETLSGDCLSFKRKYIQGLLIEEIDYYYYYPFEGYSEGGVARYVYERR